jgi:hypothetical protein
MSLNKQIYIPSITVKGSFVEEIGSEDNKVVYPGKPFELSLSAEDFKNIEDYHTVWIHITKTVKDKLNSKHE